MIQTVLVVMAMQIEASSVLDVLGAEILEPPEWVGPVPTRWYQAERSSGRVVVSVNGIDPTHGVDLIGSQPAALATYLGGRFVRPDLVITAGLAGGWQRRGAAVGDVYLNSDRFVFHDRRIDLPGFDVYGTGSWPGVEVAGLARRLGLRTGLVTTSDSLDESPEDAERILASGAEVKEMEAAAVAWAASLLGVPVMAVKIISDLVDHPFPSAADFMARLPDLCARLASVTGEVLDAVMGRELSELAEMAASR